METGRHEGLAQIAGGSTALDLFTREAYSVSRLIREELSSKRALGLDQVLYPGQVVMRREQNIIAVMRVGLSLESRIV